jgi:hypothetical protein
LSIVGLDILHHGLPPNTLAIMRMVIATATRFPKLAQLVDRIGRECGVERVAQVPFQTLSVATGISMIAGSTGNLGKRIVKAIRERGAKHERR